MINLNSLIYSNSVCRKVKHIVKPTSLLKENFDKFSNYYRCISSKDGKVFRTENSFGYANRFKVILKANLSHNFSDILALLYFLLRMGFEAIFS